MIGSSVSTLRSTVKRALNGFGYEVRRVSDGNGSPRYEAPKLGAGYAPWNQDRAFLETYRAVLAHTLVDKYRCHELWNLVEQSRKLRGSLLEVGVWRGGTGALIAKQAQLCGIREPVYLCDTFTGVVKAGLNDSTYRGGEHHNTSRQVVEELVYDRLGLDNAVILQGIFPDETAGAVAGGPLRFCHVDVDVYQSAEDVLQWLWERLVVGGIVVYDDYGCPACDGIVKHVDRQRSLADRLVIHNLNGHAVVVKTR